MAHLSLKPKAMSRMIAVIFTFEEWRICLNEVTGTKRKRFKASFDGIFSKKLQNSGTKCWVKQRYNLS